MTIQNPQAYLDNIWDWAILDGCFGDTKIMPTDIDGFVERNGHFLLIETKSPGVGVKEGQGRTFQGLVNSGLFTCMVVWGRKDKPEKVKVMAPNTDKMFDPCDLAGFRKLIAHWYKTADASQKGRVNPPFLTRTAIEKFDEVKQEIQTNNSLLLRLINQTITQ